MQVPQVTEEAAQAVVELYPTPLLLAKAYSILVSPLPSFFCFRLNIQVTTVPHVRNKFHALCVAVLQYCVLQNTFF